MTCPGCSATIPTGARFCPLCGLKLGRACPACGAVAEASHRFCLSCGAMLEEGPAPPATNADPVAGPSRSSGGTAERRLVSILFADLVGFTTLSEQRDAEEVRDLLTRYFDTARLVIVRYGGTIEKFIGDAVMAVWGAPVAHENDAELAVRAALDLLGAVASLGGEIGQPDLRARAGVVTSEAAVTVGAVGQGMVAGDAVNTASRIQSAASAGTVLVDDATRRATERAITYDDAGRHTLKGKAEAMPLWQATRVVSGRGGAQRASALEAPFVGRERELRLVKDLFHATEEERRGRVVSITGIAGIGKTRLSWEFEKYMDGIVGEVFWNRGRCVSYGEGVTYGALAEMVRGRAGILESEAPSIAAPKLRACLEEHIADAEERAWLEPRLRNLLGMEEDGPSDRVDLFAAWRVFFERLAEREPTILVFEEMQWAASGLVEFIEYLIEWTRHHPLFVITLGRPEFTDRFPSWGAGRRSFHALHLEPLTPAAMDELLTGLVPGLPVGLRQQIRERAEGIPLYAVETVRMLLDLGTLRREQNRYVFTGPPGDLAVPETLHALIAARLDALSPLEREFMQSAAVLGQTFTTARLAGLMGRGEDELRPVLEGLVHKELLGLQLDPRSPERGQYQFLQALVQRVAYETLSRRERKNRHLEAARQLEMSWTGETDETVEVAAAHYLEAYRAGPTDEDAAAMRESARRMLVRAGERAASLGAADEAQRHFTSAAELVEDDLERALLLERAGDMAANAGRTHAAIETWEEARDLYSAGGAGHAAARVVARIGGGMFLLGQARDALERLTASYEVLRESEYDADVGLVAAQMARLHFFLEEFDQAAQLIEAAIDIGEVLHRTELLCDALMTKAIIVAQRGHHSESIALLRYATGVAQDGQLFSTALRGYFNLVGELTAGDRLDDALAASEDGLALARRSGIRAQEWMLLAAGLDIRYGLGRWDEAEAVLAELPPPVDMRHDYVVLSTMLSMVHIHAARGEIEAATELLGVTESALAGSDDFQARTSYACADAALREARGDHSGALQAVHAVLDTYPHESTLIAEAISAGGEAARALADPAAAALVLRIVDERPRARMTTRIAAHANLLRGQVAAAGGDDAAAGSAFAAAEKGFLAIATPFRQATCRLACAEWLMDCDRWEEATAMLDLAEAEFVRLRAVPWIARATAARTRAEPAAELQTHG